MGGGGLQGQASEAARISSNLMQESSSIGLPAVRGVTEYATQGLNQGLPDYVKRGYEGAKTAGLEQALSEQTAGRGALRGSPVEALTSYVPRLTGAAGAVAKERAALGLSEAGTTITQRNSLMRTLLGQGAQSTNLAVGFGGLTNRGLAAGLNAGDPTYEAIVGGGSAASALALSLMKNNPSGYGNADYSSPLAATYSASQIPVL